MEVSLEQIVKAIEVLPVAVIITDLNGRIVLVNGGTEKMFGYRRNEVVGEIVEILMPQRFREIHAHHRSDYNLAPRIRLIGHGLNLIGRRKSGEEFPIEVGLSPAQTDSGLLFISMVHDITERKRLEASQRESEERFRLLANSAPVMIWMSGVDKLCTHFNQRWLDFTGRPLEAEVGNGWLGGVHPEDLTQCLDTYTKSFDQREPFQMEYRLRRHDGEYRWIVDSGTPQFDANGSFAGYLGSAIDVTERKLVENERKLALDRLQEYERAVEGLEEMVAVVDREYRYVIANSKFLKMRNMEKGQVLSHFAYEILNKGVFDAVVKEKLDECFQGKVVKYEMKYTYPELGERDILVSYFPVEGATGVERVACIVQDITDRKRMEEVLRSVNEKLIEAHEEERIRIARELHDDISQRLALLTINLNRLKTDDQTLPADIREGVTKATNYAADLSRDIQAMSHRLHSSKLEYFGLARAAASFCNELADQHKVEIDLQSEDIPDGLPEEIALCMFRVLQEALQNAIKHSRSQRFDVSFSYTEVEICVNIHDSGIGFDPDEAIKGRGLGLISMRERLKLVGGELSIESQPGHGATVHACAPLSQKSKLAQPSA